MLNIGGLFQRGIAQMGGWPNLDAQRLELRQFSRRGLMRVFSLRKSAKGIDGDNLLSVA